MLKKPILPVLLALAGILLVALYWFYPFASPATAWVEAPSPLPDSVLAAFRNQKSSIGTKENPQARQQWEWLMLHNPATGQIPSGMREKELQFARKLPQAKPLPGKRTSLETPWTSAGPYNVGGRTRALRLDVQDENTILAGGVSGGMWRSTDGGQNWTKTTRPDQLHSVTALVQDTRPGNENVWYYGTGEQLGNSARGGNAPYRGDGIFKSTDGGQSWLLLPSTSTNRPQTFDPPFDYIYNLKINTTNLLVQELYAAASGGIYRSIDGGASWSATLADNAAQYTDVEVAPDGTLYAVLSSQKYRNVVGQSGIFRSINRGVSWQNITPNGWPGEFGRVVLATNPQDPNELYALGHTPSRPILWRLNISGSDGIWTNLSENLPEEEEPVAGLDLQGGYNMLVKVHPTESQTVFVGGTNLFRSTTGFTDKEATDWIGGYVNTNRSTPYENHHPDQHELVFYPSAPNRSISAHDGGLSRTDNILQETVAWTSLNRGYVTTQFYTVGLDQSQVNDIIIGGMQDNGSHLTPSAGEQANWLRVLGGDGGYTHVANRGAYYYVSFQNSQIYRLTLNDEYRLTSFARIDPIGAGQVSGQPYLFINPYVFDPHNPNRMYLAAGDVVYRNRNVSQIPAGSQSPTALNWERLSTTAADSGSISAIAISTTPADILYYGTSRGLFYKATEVSSATPVVENLTHTGFPSGGYVAHISINPTNADEVLVVFSNYEVLSIFRSTDGGNSFVSISGNLEQFPNGSGNGPSVRHVEIIPMEDGSTLYLAGTSTGLYSTRQLAGNATRWEQEAPELIGRVVVPQVRYRSLDGRVAIATHGNGIYFKNYDGVENIYQDPEGKPFAYANPYPNPFSANAQTIIPYDLPRNGIVRIRVYDPQGKLVNTLLHGTQFAGTSEITWNGTDSKGNRLPPATYLLRMEYEDQVETRRVVLIE
ncbi:FlgD immunoglobulin-like domain containing protein [Cesiribacter andamanensis]|uniref:Flagellar basal body rod modification protein n=1 Tax=Cesiribacter andamanensis AMV16 TaxID=1279009 RepID=M7NBR9_9BACT|nr:FlgD immunoglobulin-like domain containing protein [Cesiribacter andamanensis]EMR04631.1 flagellar basal body rod modification protein [Cesiribacter andamanensis AMV16]